MTDFVTAREAARRRAADFWQAWQNLDWPSRLMSDNSFHQEANAALQPYFSHVFFQVAQRHADGSIAEIVLSAGNRSQPIADAILLAEAAPSSLPFQVQALLRRQKSADLAGKVVTFDGIELAADEVQVALAPDENGLVKLTVASQQGLPQTGSTEHVLVWQLLAAALGQWDLNVKVGDIELVAQAPEAAHSLADLPAAFDQLWRETMGHNGVYPIGNEEFLVYEGEMLDDGLLPPVLVRNESAAQLLGRADMAWCVRVSCEAYDELSLRWAQEMTTTLSGSLCQQSEGILTTMLTDLVEGEYIATWMVANPEAAYQVAQNIAKNYERINAQVSATFDPSWRHFRL